MAGRGSWRASSARGERASLEILDRVGAIAVFQLTFTDLDLSALPLPAGSIILFAYNGRVDARLQPKPALAA